MSSKQNDTDFTTATHDLGEQFNSVAAKIDSMPTKFLVIDLLRAMKRRLLFGPMQNEDMIINTLSARARTKEAFLSAEDVKEIKAHLGFDDILSPGDHAKLEELISGESQIEIQLSNDPNGMQMYERLFTALGVDARPIELLRDRVEFQSRPQKTGKIQSWDEYYANEQEAAESIKKWGKIQIAQITDHLDNRYPDTPKAAHHRKAP